MGGSGDHQHTRNGRTADGYRVVRSDQARRAMLVRPGSPEINRVDVIANALIGILTKVVHRPASRYLEGIAAEYDGLHGRSRLIRGVVGGRKPDRLGGGPQTRSPKNPAPP